MRKSAFNVKLALALHTREDTSRLLLTLKSTLVKEQELVKEQLRELDITISTVNAINNSNSTEVE